MISPSICVIFCDGSTQYSPPIGTRPVLGHCTCPEAAAPVAFAVIEVYRAAGLRIAENLDGAAIEIDKPDAILEGADGAAARAQRHSVDRPIEGRGFVDADCRIEAVESRQEDVEPIERLLVFAPDRPFAQYGFNPQHRLGRSDFHRCLPLGAAPGRRFRARSECPARLRCNALRTEPRKRSLDRADNSGRPENNKEDQNQAKAKQPPIDELVETFVHQRQGRGAGYRAPDLAETPDYHHRQQQKQQRQIEHVGAHDREVAGIHGAGEAREQRRGGKDQQLVFEPADAARDGIGRIVAQGRERHAHRAADDEHRKRRRQREERQREKIIAERRIFVAEELLKSKVAEINETARAAGEIATGHTFHEETFSVRNDQQIHGLGDGERQQRHIGAAEPQARDPDDDTENDRGDGAARHRYPQRPVQIEAKHAGNVAAHGEDRHLRQRKDAGELQKPDSIA